MKNIKQSMISGFAFSITALSTFLAYGAFVNMTEVTSSDTLTATGWNNIIGNINDLNNKVNNINLNLSNIPTGAIMAFNGTSCPNGWNMADGSGDEKNTSGINTTLDLRGTFIRGLNGNLNGRDIMRNLGHYQEDAFQGHRHDMLSENPGANNVIAFSDTNADSTYAGGGNIGSRGDAYIYVGNPTTDYSNGMPRITNETRPRNIALLYCVKN